MSYKISELLELAQKSSICPEHFEGRGIVICAGGPALLSSYVTVRSLRHHGCKLPIQIWHLGPKELIPGAQPHFERFGVEFVDAFEIRKIHPIKKIGPWEGKPFALMYSPFREVMLLDADNMVLRNPENLFDCQEYLEHGAILWPDFPAKPDDRWAIKSDAWELLRLTPFENPEIESGQLLINKERCWPALVLAMHMNENSDFFYEKCTHGDKDTFRLGFMLSKTDSYTIPKKPQMTVAPVRLQFDTHGHPLFQHSRKWQLPVDSNPRCADFLDEELCFQWLKEIAR